MGKDIITVEDPDGLYLYENGKWIKKDVADFNKGIHVVYFDNKDCLACRLFDMVWFPLVKSNEWKDIKFWVVICSWFDKRCSDNLAKGLFKNYMVKASPTTLIIKDGVVVDTIRGFLKIGELKERIEGILKKQKKTSGETATKGFWC